MTNDDWATRYSAADALAAAQADSDLLRAALADNEKLQRRAEAAEGERDALAEELATVRFAAHMPDDYLYGLATWINMELYGKLVRLLDRDGRVIRRSEDIEEMIRLRAERDRLAEQSAAVWETAVREQLERDCAVVCSNCRHHGAPVTGGTPGKRVFEHWVGIEDGESPHPEPCRASQLRAAAALAASELPPAGKVE